MLPDRVSNPGPPTYKSGALPIALCGPAEWNANKKLQNFSLWKKVAIYPCSLTLKAPIASAVDNSVEYFLHCFSEKIGLDISCESFARQKIHMKHQAYLFWKIKEKKHESVSAAILLCSLRIKFSFNPMVALWIPRSHRWFLDFNHLVYIRI